MNEENKHPVTEEELEELRKLHSEPLKGKNDGVVKQDREVVSHLQPDTMYIIYRKVPNDFHLLIQVSGKSSTVKIEESMALQMLNVYDPEAYEMVLMFLGYVNVI